MPKARGLSYVLSISGLRLRASLNKSRDNQAGRGSTCHLADLDVTNPWARYKGTTTPACPGFPHEISLFVSPSSSLPLPLCCCWATGLLVTFPSPYYPPSDSLSLLSLSSARPGVTCPLSSTTSAWCIQLEPFPFAPHFHSFFSLEQPVATLTSPS